MKMRRCPFNEKTKLKKLKNITVFNKWIWNRFEVLVCPISSVIVSGFCDF
jgi:hypothetical protein